MSRDEKRCTYCGLAGHRASHCPRRLAQHMAKPATSSPKPVTTPTEVRHA